MNINEEKIYACWLDAGLEFARAKKRLLLKAAGSARQAYSLVVNSASGMLEALIGAEDSRKLTQYLKTITPQGLCELLEEKDIGYTYFMESDYPQKFVDIPDAPFGIFYKGELADENTSSVAVIGSRKCSEYGRHMAKEISGGLAARGINIVSGMALGIDGIAQGAAIDAGGRTYGVLGCGVDYIYPASNEELYYKIIKNGAIISEYAPETKPQKWLFPMRNRLISALSDVVIVIEANEKSGTFSTVDMALEQGREVYAVPGRCTDRMSTGCNKLLRQGAGLVTSAEDIIYDMGWRDKLNPAHRQSDKTKAYLSQPAKDIYDVLDIMPLTQDDIITLLQKKGKSYAVDQVSRALCELELRQAALKINGGYQLMKP